MDDFELMLSKRDVPPPQHDFSERIIKAALAIEQRQEISLSLSIKRILAELIPARPAYAMVGIVMLGLICGLALPEHGAVFASESFYDEGGL